jgi:hypothetical protein
VLRQMRWPPRHGLSVLQKETRRPPGR